MTDIYRVTSTSKSSAEVDHRELARTDTTRRIIKANIHHNPNDAEAVVKITLIHQRKSSTGAWEDIDSPALSTLKGGELAKMSLSSAETLALWKELSRLYAIYEVKGVPRGDRDLVVAEEHEIVRTDARRASMIRRLLKKGYTEEIWRTLVAEDPDLATRLSFARIQSERRRSLGEFKRLIERDAPESELQSFLDRNSWIFGYGLNYRVLGALQAQPHYGGANVRGTGGHRGDNLQMSIGAARFTVLVEIKRASTALLGPKYRNGAHGPSPELGGAISQVQVNCRTWSVEGSQTEANREYLGDVLTAQPKGILVIGHCRELDSREKKIAFELLRRNTSVPEIITFDELLARASFIVGNDSAGDAAAGAF